MRALARLGDASYALYLVHPFALRLGREILVRLGLAGTLHPWGSLILMTLLAVVVALAVHRFVEAPLTRLLRARLEKPWGPPRQAVFMGGKDR